MEREDICKENLLLQLCNRLPDQLMIRTRSGSQAGFGASSISIGCRSQANLSACYALTWSLGLTSSEAR